MMTSRGLSTCLSQAISSPLPPWSCLGQAMARCRCFDGGSCRPAITLRARSWTRSRIVHLLEPGDQFAATALVLLGPGDGQVQVLRRRQLQAGHHLAGTVLDPA